MSVSRETGLKAYTELLLRWSGSLNLSSRRLSGTDGFLAQIDDSLLIVPQLPPSADRLIDLGSGQGFPAIPIAIETGIAIDLIEADRRKAAFLTTVIATLGLNGTVWPTRIESAAVAPALCITARALGSVGDLLTLAKPLLREGGCCLFLKGPRAELEVSDAARHHRFNYEIFPTPSPRSNLVKITRLG